MTDHTDHHREAERMLADANEWAAQAGELSPKARERACLAYAQVHALLAIHDTLTSADRYAANEAKQRAGFPPVFHGPDERLLAARPAPLAFAPEAAQEATGGDLSASESESGDEERGDPEDAAEPLLCDCRHAIDRHLTVLGCLGPEGSCVCDCDLSASDIARALIEQAVKQTGGGHV